ncbi:hydroxymethylglutaryl-CoA lyase [Brevibacterium sp. RIT 803]|uniref:hydroxymethylglutaryl-CoA lyase n=1 Tax=Brevibacterium sp. RIT 803 TaxID=2810210 RepID=UPI00194E920B|nr:hydroxymethylglutaryl-CoA lyase [Brevibacterium sp. RIT 803]MBM6590449.1 hydroxymethylglutaryl-CoA lyase [Brevibacterium sp. RIT 803]
MRKSQARITDVVLRDGLQDEPRVTSVEDRLLIAAALVEAGITDIEAASFVNPKRVPQMSGAEELAGLVSERPAITWRALALNRRGVDRAVAAGFTTVTLVVSASAAHSRANAGRSPSEAIAELAPIVESYPGVDFSGGISTAFVCPFEGDIAPEAVTEIAGAYADIGVSRIGLADTIGTARPQDVEASLEHLRGELPDVDLSLHLHNAKGQAFDTVDRALDLGITEFDAATGGYGGCPFAPGAHGNIATEELVEHLSARGYETGIDLEGLAEVRKLLTAALARGTPVAA